MSSATPQVLLEDNHLLVVNKPAPLATMGTGGVGDTLVDWAREYLRHKYQKPGNVYIGVVSRLDALVTGVVPLARTSKSAARLTAAFRDRRVEKSYLAWIPGVPPQPSGPVEHYLCKEESRHRMRVCGPQAAGAQLARLEYLILGEHGGDCLLQISLLTGRKHQIRAQLAELGYPILGDAKYGSTRVFRCGIALHAAQLRFPHPVGGAMVQLAAPVPSYWPKSPRWCASN